MWLLVGLGNPGKGYANHRHNAGFMAADALSAAFSFGTETKKFSALISEGKIGTEKIILLKPQTYMNLSGESVGQAARFYKIPTENILVMHDELDIPLGKVKVKQGGGAGGHNGLKSIDAHVGQASERSGSARSEPQNNYWRLRIGIGHPGHKDYVSDYVLSNFAKDEVTVLEELLKKIPAALPLLLSGKPAEFTNQLALTA